MRFDLAGIVRRLRRPRRRSIPIRDIAPPGVLAADLFRAVYLPAVQAWGRGLPRIEAEYARTLAAMTTDSPADLDRDLGSIGDEVRRLLLELTPRMREWLVRVETWHRGKWRGAVLSATGVDLQTLIGPEDVAEPLEAVLRRNVELVRDISDEARGRIADAVFRGLTNRTPARDVARELREAVGMARRRSVRVASDQLVKAASTLDDERRRQAGLDVWRWRHSGKRHPREHHQARDGNLYSDDSAMVGRKVDGKTVLAPPDANDRPGRPPHCGCRAQAVMVFD